MSAEGRTAIIGAGFGGLALALRLQAQGRPTTVIERRDKPGGRAYVHEADGFVFDGGPTVITDPTALEELFALAGRRLEDYVELLPVDPMYRLYWEDGDTFDYTNEPGRLEQQIAARSPGDVNGYNAFLDYSRAVFDTGYRRLGSVPFLRLRDMLAITGNLVRLGAHRSVYSVIARYLRDERLRQAFSFHPLLIGGNPFRTSAIYTLIHALEREWGVWFPRGGTGALIDGMVRLYRELGGELRLATPVERIETQGGRAQALRFGDGRSERYDAVASNADVVHTYGRLLRDHPRGPREARRLARYRHSMSLFVIYFGVRGHYPDLPHHMVLFGPRYRELISDIFDGAALPEDFALYLHAPSNTDPSLAPPGCSSFYVLSPVPHLGNAAIDWDIEGPRYARRILAYLEQRHMPGLTESLVTMKLLTPFGFRDDLNAHLGSAFSVEPLLHQSAWFRPHNRDARIRNLYLVGAGTHPGAGVPGVLASAKATAGLMLADRPTQGSA